MKIFLIGFMGSGKTHVGKQLAKQAGLDFIDLDAWLEKKEQRSIAAIFASEGEAAFRKKERAILHETATVPKAIISTGGGAPCFFDNMAWMNQQGITIYLETPLEILTQRLLLQRAKRPLIQNLTAEELQIFIQDKIAQRAPFYQQAQMTYRTTEANEDVAGALWKQFSNSFFK